MKKEVKEPDQTTDIRPSVKVRLTKTRPFFGPGTCQLLELVEKTGSLQEACHKMNLSYSKGFRMIKEAEIELGFSVTERWAGGASGGGSRLTEQGKWIVEQYQCFVQEIERYTEQTFEQYFMS